MPDVLRAGGLRRHLGEYYPRDRLEGFAGEVGAEDFGDADAEVFGLVVFDDGDHDAAEGEGSGVVGVDELDVAVFATDAGF